MENPQAGLCDRCSNCKRVASARGTSFYLCLLHERDPAGFPKYPRLPVLTCPGYAERPPQIVR
jgi:hypothetical protein